MYIICYYVWTHSCPTLPPSSLSPSLPLSSLSMSLSSGSLLASSAKILYARLAPIIVLAFRRDSIYIFSISTGFLFNNLQFACQNDPLCPLSPTVKWSNGLMDPELAKVLSIWRIKVNILQLFSLYELRELCWFWSHMTFTAIKCNEYQYLLSNYHLLAVKCSK